MYDVQLDWGRDLTVSSTGDLALVSGVTWTNQRVIRRLLTSAGDYIWNLSYGGSLALFVGSTATPAYTEGVIRSQIALESSVSSDPAATIAVQSGSQGNGMLIAQIGYTEATSDLPASLNIITG